MKHVHAAHDHKNTNGSDAYMLTYTISAVLHVISYHLTTAFLGNKTWNNNPLLSTVYDIHEFV